MSDRLRLGRLEFLGEALRAGSASAAPARKAPAFEAHASGSSRQVSSSLPDLLDDEELPSFVVTYELGADWKAEDYKRLYRILRSFGSWTWVLDSVWVLRAPNAQSVREAIRPLLTQSDRLVVMQLTKPGDDLVDRDAYRPTVSSRPDRAVAAVAFG